MPLKTFFVFGMADVPFFYRANFTILHIVGYSVQLNPVVFLVSALVCSHSMGNELHACFTIPIFYQAFLVALKNLKSVFKSFHSAVSSSRK